MKAIYIFVLSILTFFISTNLQGQDIQSLPESTRVRNTAKYQKLLYFSTLGPTLGYGVNLDIRLRRDVSNGLGLRLGFGGSPKVPHFESSEISFPLGVNYVIGQTDHKILCELGLLNIYDKIWRVSVPYPVGVYSCLGYRYVSSQHRLMAQLAWSPIHLFEGLGTFPIWMEASIGIQF